MTSTVAKPSRQALAIPGRSAPGKVTGKLKVAIETMDGRAHVEPTPQKPPD
jgi:hypothetical protein